MKINKNDFIFLITAIVVMLTPFFIIHSLWFAFVLDLSWWRSLSPMEQVYNDFWVTTPLFFSIMFGGLAILGYSILCDKKGWFTNELQNKEVK